MPEFGMISQEDFEEALAAAGFLSGGVAVPRTKQPDPYKPVAEREIGGISLNYSEKSPGLRVRAFMWFPRSTKDGVTIGHGGPVVPNRDSGPWTYGELMNTVSIPSEARDALTGLQLRVTNPAYAPPMVSNIDEIEDISDLRPLDPELHPALQDLGWILGYELTKACAAFDNPDIYYPGIPTVEPVTDEHAEMVAKAAKREIHRESKRLGRKCPPLEKLPMRIKRAYAERRRYWYGAYGIGRAEYLSNTWNLFNVEERSEWTPPWIA